VASLVTPLLTKRPEVLSFTLPHAAAAITLPADATRLPPADDIDGFAMLAMPEVLEPVF